MSEFSGKSTQTPPHYIKSSNACIRGAGSNFQHLAFHVWFYGHGLTGFHHRKGGYEACPVRILF